MYAREQTCLVRKSPAEVLISHFYAVFMTMARTHVHRTLAQTFDHLFFERISLRETGRRDESFFRCFWDLIWDNNVEIQWLIFTGKCAKCETVILPTNFSKLKISQIILAGKLMEQIREVHHIFVYVLYVYAYTW